MKIVSLLPSATEIVYALGLGDQLEGVTDECDFPPEAREKPVVSRSALPAGRRFSVALKCGLAATHARTSSPFNTSAQSSTLKSCTR